MIGTARDNVIGPHGSHGSPTVRDHDIDRTACFHDRTIDHWAAAIDAHPVDSRPNTAGRQHSDCAGVAAARATGAGPTTPGPGRPMPTLGSIANAVAGAQTAAPTANIKAGMTFCEKMRAAGVTIAPSICASRLRRPSVDGAAGCLAMTNFGCFSPAPPRGATAKSHAMLDFA